MGIIEVIQDKNQKTGTRVKLAVITTHPIQYYAPLFRALAKSQRIILKVFYTWSQARESVYDPDFGISRSWDIPLLDGYDHSFIENTSPKPGSHHFKGIVNPGLNKAITDWGADAVIIFGWNFDSHFKAMKYFKGRIPVIFRGDSTLLDEAAGISIKRVLRRISLTWIYRYIDYALYVGQANKAYYKAHGVSENKLVYAPHAVDNDRFAANAIENQDKADTWRSELGITQSDLVFLFAGKLSSKKNPEILIKAFLIARSNSTNAKLVIAGNGELENNLKEKYASHPNIIFLGFQNQSMMPVLYRLADVYVLPSQGPGETWGLAVNEAMACGRPTIVSNKCGCSYDVIQQDKNGFSFEYNSIDQLEKALSHSKEHYRLLGEHAASSIRSFSYQQIVATIEKLAERFK